MAVHHRAPPVLQACHDTANGEPGPRDRLPVPPDAHVVRGLAVTDRSVQRPGGVT